jgi:hypothetical protein
MISRFSRKENQEAGFSAWQAIECGQSFDSMTLQNLKQ